LGVLRENSMFPSHVHFFDGEAGEVKTRRLADLRWALTTLGV
jgi:hypothetical protein